ncbi:MAG: DM13 domain-containing protein [Woeseiaceae bacterium]|nr:DM13 domain-containing protein [Woeseiaceae bacterium]
MKWLIRIGTHAAAVGVGFVLGIYMLPILIAPEGPGEQEVQSAANNSEFTAEFRRDLEDSDALHWGEGTLYVGPDTIALDGQLAPGPDYRLYLSPEFVETEAAFEALKSQMVEVGPIRTFENFMVSVPDSVDPAAFSTAIVWCESFGQFITAAEYQKVLGGG